MQGPRGRQRSVCERECLIVLVRERVCGFKRERDRERERGVSVCLYVREREFECVNVFWEKYMFL